MDLGLSDEQRALVAAFGGLLAKESSPERVRAAEPGGFDRRLFGALLDVGALEMAVSDEIGLLDLALVAECLGAAVAPAPIIEAQVALRLLAAVGAPTGEERLVTLAVRPAVDGVATLVPAGAVADDALVLDGDRLLLVPLDGRRTPVANLASAPLADVDVTGGTVLCTGADALMDTALDEWLVLTAAALVGTAASAHRVTCAYARERTSWGRPIGSHQAVAHPLADDAVAIDGARLLVQEAAWTLGADAGPRGRTLASMAFAFAAETARAATYHAVHFHGGYGFMLEHDAQLYYRRARGWARVWGSPADAYRRAAPGRRSVLSREH